LSSIACIRKAGVLHGTWMVLRCLSAEPELLKPDRRDSDPLSCRLGVVVSSKVNKRAVRRNQLRRLLQGHLSATVRAEPDQGRGRWLLVSLKPGSADVSDEALLEECSRSPRQGRATPMSAAAQNAPVAPGASVNEEVFYEGGPAKGDLITNLLFGLTLIGLPFAVGALVRALWLRFRITSRPRGSHRWLAGPRSHPGGVQPDPRGALRGARPRLLGRHGAGAHRRA